LNENHPTWTGRIPQDVKEYFQKKGYSAGQIFIEFYKILKQQEIPNLLQEKKDLEERVRQIDEIVTHQTLNCKTKTGICNTSELDEICKQYLQPREGLARDVDSPTSQDKSWIRARLKGLHIDEKTFLERCGEIQEENKESEV